MDNEINPLAKHSQHFSKYAMFYRGIIFEDVRSRERRKPAERGLLANHSSRASLWECYGCTRQENDMGVYQ